MKPIKRIEQDPVSIAVDRGFGSRSGQTNQAQ